MHSMWETKIIVGATTLLALLVSYYLVTPPIVVVPARIEAQWDSIWLTGKPEPCSADSPAWCSGQNKEYLGCVMVSRGLGVWTVTSWQPAEEMKRLATTVSGVCATSFNAMWHIHPAEVDAKKLHLNFFRELSGTDLTTLYGSAPPAAVSLMTWAPKHLTAAIVWRGRLVYPVTVQTER